MKEAVSLRKMGIEVHLTARMYGNSLLWLFTRIDGAPTSSTPIVVLKKKKDHLRLYSMYGGLEQEKFSVHKRQEVPTFYYNAEEDSYSKEPIIKQISEDFLDVKIKAFDNGDSTFCLQICLSKSKTLAQVFNKAFEHPKNKTKVLVAGSGNSVYLREIEIGLVKRRSFFKGGIHERSKDCCNIF